MALMTRWFPGKVHQWSDWLPRVDRISLYAVTRFRSPSCPSLSLTLSTRLDAQFGIRSDFPRCITLSSELGDVTSDTCQKHKPDFTLSLSWKQEHQLLLSTSCFEICHERDVLLQNDGVTHTEEFWFFPLKVSEFLAENESTFFFFLG